MIFFCDIHFCACDLWTSTSMFALWNKRGLTIGQRGLYINTFSASRTGTQTAGTVGTAGRPSTCDLGNNGVIHPVPQLCCLAKILEKCNDGRISNSYKMFLLGTYHSNCGWRCCFDLFWMFAMIKWYSFASGNLANETLGRLVPIPSWRRVACSQSICICIMYCWTSRCPYLISLIAEETK